MFDRRAYQRAWTKKNRKKCTRWKLAWRKRVGDVKTVCVLSILLKTWPCSDCGKFYPHYVMHFDHVHGNKKKHVSSIVASGNLNDFWEEVAKCEVVCANCHAERTWG